jgi:hypothetical protein
VVSGQLQLQWIAHHQHHVSKDEEKQKDLSIYPKNEMFF